MSTAAKPSEVLLPPLVDACGLHAALGDPRLRVFDATAKLHVAPSGGSFSVTSREDGYRQAHVPGAAFADLPGGLSEPQPALQLTVPSPGLFSREAGRLGICETSHVVVYSHASPIWATRLWWLLRYFGMSSVSVLDGGLGAWQRAGYEVERGGSVYPSAPGLSVTPNSNLLARRRDVAAIVYGWRSAGLVNALAPNVFRGEGPSAYARPGRIPGSRSVPWTELVDPDTGQFRSLPDLHARFARAGAAVDGEIVAYCGAGISATLNLFALSLLGHDARLYDGSLAEWAADPELPLALG